MNLYLLYTLLLLTIGSVLALVFIYNKDSFSYMFFIICLFCFSGTPYRIISKIQGGISLDYVAGLRDIFIFTSLVLFGLKIRLKNTLFYNLLIAIIILYCISVVFSFDNIFIGIWGIRWGILPIIFGFLFTELYFKRNKTINLYLKFIAIIILLQSLYGIYQWYNFPEIDAPISDSYQDIKEEATIFTDSPLMTGTHIRTYSFTYGITDITHFLPQIGIIMILLLFSNDYRTGLNLIAAFAYILWLFIAKEKAAIATTFIGLFTCILLNFLFKIKLKYFILIMIILITWFTFSWMVNTGKIEINNAHIYRISNLTNPLKVGTGKSRFNIWQKEIIPKIVSNPFGYGVGMARYSKATEGVSIRAPHNLYFQIILEIGIIGLTIFAFIIFLYLLKLFKCSKQLIKSDYAISLALTSSIISVLIYGIVSVPLDQSGGIFFWISLFMSYYIMSQYTQTRVTKCG